MENLTDSILFYVTEQPFTSNDLNYTRQGYVDNGKLWGPTRDSLYIVIPVTILYSFIFFTGIIGNVSTCIVIARNRHMHTATNYYLFSLAISDLLLLVSGLPQEMIYNWSKYPYLFGEWFCVLSGLAAETSTNATVLTITAFTIERYVAICHPFLTHTFSKLSRAIKFVIGIWAVAFSCAVPQAMNLGLVYAKNETTGLIISEEYKICAVKTPVPYSFEISTILFFFLPMSIITVLYVLIGVRLHRSTGRRASQRLRDSRRNNNVRSTRVVKMLVVVVVAFFICWAPFQAQRLFALYGESSSPTMVVFYKFITYMSGLLYYLSTTVNPFLYNIMSLKFREAFKSTLTRCLNGRDVLRSEVGGGSSNGGGHVPRFNYSVLSHRSLRNNHSISSHNINNNNSCSSGNSYDGGDLNRRPLVVSFKRKSARTSTTSLEYMSPEKRELLQVPKLESFQRNVKQAESQFRGKHEKKNGCQKVPRIEDIEIFQESQLRIERKGRAGKESEIQSCSVFSQDKKHSSLNEEGEVDTINLVKKSFTVPCLMMN